MKIIEMDSNYRVYVASASDINEAQSLASSLSERYPGSLGVPSLTMDCRS